MQTILLVDDDPSIRDVVNFALEKDGYGVVQAGDGQAALAAYDRHSPDLIILDIMMPEMDGTEVCRRIRLTSRVPIIFLSARDEEIDRVLGLELGGDDYMTKPFSPRELLARVRAVLRRAIAPEQEETARVPASELSHGILTLDPHEYQALWGDQRLVLTLTEFGILRTLLSQPGKVFKREDFMAQAYDLSRIVSDRTIDSHIRRVRRKFAALGGNPIETVHGIGYKLGPCLQEGGQEEGAG